MPISLPDTTEMKNMSYYPIENIEAESVEIQKYVRNGGETNGKRAGRI